MKKFLITLVSVLALSSAASAQLRVYSNGHVQLGNWEVGLYGNIQPAFVQDGLDSSVLKPQTCDTTTTISILGPDTKNYSGGSLAFGGRQDVVVREATFTAAPNYKFGSMTLVGKGGLQYMSSKGTIFSYTQPSASLTDPAFTFSVNVQSSKFLTSSDARYKKNVESLENMGSLLGDLTPVSYNLQIPAAGEDGMAQKASEAVVDPHRSFGFIAQEVREIFPELVYEDGDGMLSVDYNGFIPLLVDAYKNLNAKVAEQEKVIADLTEANRRMKGAASISDVDSEETVVLMQNRPNPFRDTTEIRCRIPETVSDAFICIYDLNGRQQMRLNIAERGEVTVPVSGSSLQPGIYLYSLITDGREADTKRMILTE